MKFFIGLRTLTVASALASAGGAAWSQDCSKMDDVRFQIFEGSVINIQPMIALRQGFFSKHCINGIPVPIANTPAAVTGTLNGTVDVINSGADNLVVALIQGVQMKIFANVADKPIYSLVVRPEKIGATYQETLNNLVGGKVGVVTVGASNEFHARLHFSDAGIDPESVNWIGLGPTPNMLAGLEHGIVDAVEFFGTAQDVAEAQGFGKIVSDTRRPATDENPVPPTFEKLGRTALVWAAQESYLSANPEVTERFVAAVSEASAWIRDPANRDEVYELMRDQFSVPASLPNAEAVYRQSVDIYAGMVSAELDREALTLYIDFAKSTRSLDGDLSLDDLVWDVE